MDYASQIDTFLLRGNGCAEALLRFALTLKGEENEPLVQAAGGLSRGMHCQNLCGALTGGVLMLSLFDKGLASQVMIPELVEWFDGEYGMACGSMNCEDISGPRFVHRAERCKSLTIAVGLQCVGLLQENGLLER